MPSASCPARDFTAGAEAPPSTPITAEAWSALTQRRPDLVVDGWLRDARITDLRSTGVDAFVITAVFVRANGMFDQRTWLIAPEELEGGTDL